MSFKKMAKSPYPPRLWALYGYPGSGKSTFATQMKSPILIIDSDHRFREVMELVSGPVYELSAVPSDNVQTHKIAECLARNMEGSGVATIVVDSLTAIIAPLVTQAIIDKDRGAAKNLSAAFKAKAMAMRQIQDAVTRWGTDCLWTYHLQDGRDGKGNEQTTTSVTQTELARLHRSLNMQLMIVHDGRTRGVKVVWARSGRQGMTIWDVTGMWEEVPDIVEHRVYGGLTKEEMESVENGDPIVFPTPAIAIAWAIEKHAFDNIPHARNAYNKIKESLPGGSSAKDMAAAWIADVNRRVEELEEVSE